MNRSLLASLAAIPLLALTVPPPAGAALPQATLSAVATVAVGERPITPVLDELTGRLYVANTESASISAIDTTSNTVSATITVGTPLDDQIEELALDSARGRLFALIPYTGSLVVIDTRTNVVSKRVAIKGEPAAMVLDSVRGRLYVLTARPARLITLAPATGAVLRTVAAPTGATMMALNPVNGRLYMNSLRSNTESIVALNPSNARVIWRMAHIDFGAAVVPDATRSLLYVPLADDEDPGTLVVLDTRARRQVARIPVGMWPGLPVLDTARQRLYLSTENETTVTVIDTTTNAVVGRIATGGSPSTPTLGPASRHLFVSTWARSGSSLLMVDPATRAIVARAAVGDGPSQPVVNGAGTRVYVANTLDDTVSVIDVRG